MLSARLLPRRELLYQTLSGQARIAPGLLPNISAKDHTLHSGLR